MTPRLAPAVLVLVATTACSSGSSSPKAAPSPSGSSGPTITINNFQYSTLQVAPGTTITVKNLDDAEHTVTSDSKGLFSVDDVSDKPKTFTAPTKPGTYTFFCKYHSTMHGTLTVS